MSAAGREIRVKRVCPSKRWRDGGRSHLSPAGKPAGAPQPCPRTRGSIMEYCSDSEDLFGDYDSLLEDSSLLAKLDDAEQSEHQRQDLRGVDGQQDSTPRWPRKDNVCEQPREDVLTDSILDAFTDEAVGDAATSQQGFLEHVEANGKKSKLQDANRTSTPFRNADKRKNMEDRDRRQVRRSVSAQLKRTMLCNAAAPASVSRSVVLKEAVVSKEMGVAMEAASARATDLGPFFGLPTKVKELIYKLRGIKSLYDWQETCLNLDCIHQRKNLIYSLPTGGGKTLVAEILLLRELLCRRRDGLFVLPYISLVQEKVRGLAGLGLELDFMVEEYAGNKGRFPPVKRRNQRSLYVATIEKAHSLVNSLMEAERLDQLGLVVVDELHMLGDGSRGAIIEMTLAKVLYQSKTTQLIGMSATLGNVKELQTFLKAENFTNTFRPVQLREYVKLKDTIYEVEPGEEDCFRFSRHLNFKYSGAMNKDDPDHIIALVTEVIPRHSCLVFCPTKKNCENVAAMICKYLKQDFLQHRAAEKAVLLRELKDSGGGSMCPVLRRTVPFGVAYHHSGLTSEERKLVEEAYSSGILCLLTCTSTLAAGINLPARRVILRSPYLATDFLKRSQYKQMVGRAGRAGIDVVGESILILQDKDRMAAKTLVCTPMENCYSNLLQDEERGIQSLILSLVGLKVAQSLDQMLDFLRGTLLYVQQEQLCVKTSLWDVILRSVRLLQDKGLITTTADGEALQVTRLGNATYKGSVDLTYSDVLYRDLSRGLEGLQLNSFLHLVYLVTPYDLISQCKPNWMTFYTQFTLLSAAEQKMSGAVGVPESFVARKAAGQTVKKVPADSRLRPDTPQLHVGLLLLRAALHRGAGRAVALASTAGGADATAQLLCEGGAYPPDGGGRGHGVEGEAAVQRWL
ncbi:helicase POLQ-like isoform 2-T2 [Aulostomus maculatus]